MEYHYFPTSHWSRILSLVIAEKGLEPERRFVDLTRNATLDPEYLRLNPRGVVPTVVIDGEVVWDGPRIAKRLDAVAEPELFPDTPVVTAWAERLEAFPAMLLSYSVWVAGKRGEKSATILDAKIELARKHAEENPDLRERFERKQKFFENFRAEVYDGAHVAGQEQTCAALLDELGEHVRGQSWIAGDRYTFPDAIATAILFRLVDLGKVDAWSRDPAHALQPYWKRLQARPSFAQVFVDDPLIPERFRLR